MHDTHFVGVLYTKILPLTPNHLPIRAQNILKRAFIASRREQRPVWPVQNNVAFPAVFARAELVACHAELAKRVIAQIARHPVEFPELHVLNLRRFLIAHRAHTRRVFVSVFALI